MLIVLSALLSWSSTRAEEVEAINAAQLPAAYQGRWERAGARLQITSGHIILGHGARDHAAALLKVVERDDGYRLEYQPKHSLSSSQVMVRLRGNRLHWSEQPGRGMKPDLAAVLEKAGLEPEMIQKGVGPFVAVWRRPSVDRADRLARLEAAVDRWVQDVEQSAAARAVLAQAWPSQSLVDVYTRRDGSSLTIDFILDGSKWPLIVRLGERGQAQAGFAHPGQVVEGRDFVALALPFRGTDLPPGVEDWLAWEVVPRLLADAGEQAVVMPQPALPGLPAVRLFDSPNEVRRACADLRPVEPDLGMEMYESAACGHAWLGEEIPLRFGFHNRRLRQVSQWRSPVPNADRPRLSRNLDTLSQLACGEVADRCDVVRGEFMGSVETQAAVRIEAAALPPPRGAF